MSLFIPAFIAGVLTFLAPCTLPLVPAYFAAIAGVSLRDFDVPSRRVLATWKVFSNGVWFVLGFSTVFVALGMLAGFVGGVLFGESRLVLEKAGGIFAVLSGLSFLGVLRLPFFSSRGGLKVVLPLAAGNASHSFFLGAAFAFGWTPCVGPVVGTILFLASSSQTALQGSLLLVVFAAGLAVPFLVVAGATGFALRAIQRFSGAIEMFSRIGGLFLIGFGILLFFGKLGLFVSYGYHFFRFLEYGRLLDYL